MAGCRYGVVAFLYGVIAFVAAPLVCAAPLPASGVALRAEWHETVLYRFHGPQEAIHGDGAFPQGGVSQDAGGRLFGTTSAGGSNGNGTVFALAPPVFAYAPWSPTILHEFANAGDDGASPVDRPLLGADGMLYGTTQAGGAFCHGEFCIGGTVFALLPPPANLGLWTERVLLSFSDTSRGGDAPRGDLIASGTHTLYGTAALTFFGKAGTVFRLDGGLNGGSETVVHAFSLKRAADGVFPEGGVIADASGNLYGTTLEGGDVNGWCGDSGCGVVYELSPSGRKDEWTERVLHTFSGSDGSNPFASLVLNRRGVLFGTTYSGGASACERGCGVVFSLTPPAARDGGWTESVLHYFGKTQRDGYWPLSTLVADDRGVLYGTTLNGGDRDCGGGDGCGTAFALVPPRRGVGAWTERVLHRFDGVRAHDGEGPAAGLLLSGGMLYGTTEIGGGGRCYNGCGTVFQLTPPSGGVR